MFSLNNPYLLTNQYLVEDDQYHAITITRINDRIHIKYDDRIVMFIEDGTFGAGHQGLVNSRAVDI